MSKYFRVFIPGFGNVWVETTDRDRAISVASGVARNNGFDLTSADVVNFTATPSNGPVEGSATGYVVNAQGALSNLTGNTSTVGNPGKVPGNASPLPPESNEFSEPENVLARNPLLGETTQFRQFLRGQGANPELLGGRLLSRFQEPARSLFDIGTATGTFGGTNPGAPANVDANNPFQRALETGLLQTLGSNALNTFRDLIRSQPGNAAADLFRNAAPGDATADELRQVAALALGGRTNLGFASRFGDQIVNQIGRNYQERADLNPALNQTFAQALNEGLRLGA